MDRLLFCCSLLHGKLGSKYEWDPADFDENKNKRAADERYKVLHVSPAEGETDGPFDLKADYGDVVVVTDKTDADAWRAYNERHGPEQAGSIDPQILEVVKNTTKEEDQIPLDLSDDEEDIAETEEMRCGLRYLRGEVLEEEKTRGLTGLAAIVAGTAPDPDKTQIDHVIVYDPDEQFIGQDRDLIVDLKLKLEV